MYNLADSTWKLQPALMSDRVTRTLAHRIAAHASRHNLRIVHVILHGGEPLLMGKRRLEHWVRLLRAECGGEVVPAFSIQSNGILIDDEWIDLLANLGVYIGLSVDGPAPIHDLHRRDHAGRGSFKKVLSAIRR